MRSVSKVSIPFSVGDWRPLILCIPGEIKYFCVWVENSRILQSSTGFGLRVFMCARVCNSILFAGFFVCFKTNISCPIYVSLISMSWLSCSFYGDTFIHPGRLRNNSWHDRLLPFSGLYFGRKIEVDWRIRYKERLTVSSFFPPKYNFNNIRNMYCLILETRRRLCNNG